MRQVAPAAAFVLLASLSFLPAVSGQASGQGTVWDFDLIVPEGEQEIPSGFQRHFTLTVFDRSIDGPAGLVPGAPSTTVSFHYIDFEVTPLLEDTKGWFLEPVIGFQIVAGERKTTLLGIRVDPDAENPYFAANVNATMRTDGGTFSKSATLLFFSPGIRGFSVRPGGSLELGPNDLRTTSLIVTNAYNQPHTFDVRLVDNPCGILVGAPASIVVPERSSKAIPFSVQAPRNQFWYNSLDCSLGFQTTAIETGHTVLTGIGVTINGFYVDPIWIFWIIASLLALWLLLFLLARRKERIEEEILGKPQKPWLIPVEALYLKALRRKDQRAWYVVRHYLMEDEYRSSLLWYKAYKKRTRGTRKQESLVLRQERGYERWKKAWGKKIAKPIAMADRHEVKLQKKLDRQARKAHRKQMRKYRAVVAKMETAHNKKLERVLAKHEKAVAKARKKGQPVPEKPSLAKPDYPDEPVLVPIALAEHKWAKKAAKFRAKQVRRQGDLEVKFEKADARRLAKVRRKVQRMARKLDDPDFVAEHPLLQES